MTLSIGVEGALAADSSSKFYVYPDIRIAYQVIPDYLKFYLSATGGLYRNSMKEASSINPWVNPIFPLGNTHTKYNIKGGLTGMITPELDYNFSVSYADIADMLFFMNDFFNPYNPETNVNLGNKFTGLYDDVNLTTVNLELGYHQSEQLLISFSADYRHYKMATEEKPWHKPAFQAKASAKYRLNKKISITGDLFYDSRIYARTYENNIPAIVKRDGFFDLNLGGEYRFSDRISAFVRLNNVAAVRYFRWYNYPSQRINVMGGLTFSF